MSDIFNRGNGDWDKLLNFIDENEFTILDFLACICANLLRENGNKFETELVVGGEKFEVTIKKGVK